MDVAELARTIRQGMLAAAVGIACQAEPPLLVSAPIEVPAASGRAVPKTVAPPEGELGIATEPTPEAATTSERKRQKIATHPVPKDCCVGKNDCKGQSGCVTRATCGASAHNCAGQNQCKGKGTSCPRTGNNP